MKMFRQSAYVLPLVALLFVAPAFAFDDQSMTGDKTKEHQTELSMSGSLKSVNPDTKTLVISCSDAAGASTEAEFHYDESTTIMGAQSTIEGLSTSSGSQVTVFYKEDGDKKKATRIEVQAASTTPAEPSPTPDPSQPSPTPDQPQPDQPQPDQPQPEPNPGTPPGA